MCLYKELFIYFEIPLRQTPKSEIYRARNIFIVLNLVLSSYPQGYLATHHNQDN